MNHSPNNLRTREEGDNVPGHAFRSQLFTVTDCLALDPGPVTIWRMQKVNKVAWAYSCFFRLCALTILD